MVDLTASMMVYYLVANWAQLMENLRDLSKGMQLAEWWEDYLVCEMVQK